MKNKKRTWIILAIVAVLVIAAVIAVSRMKAAATKALESMGAMTYTVEKGTILSTATATGQLSAAETVNVELPDGLRIIDIPVAVGDEVKAGDPLCTLDPAIVYAQLIYEARQMTAADNRVSGKGKNDTITAPCNARVKLIYAAEGDDVLTDMGQYGALAVLSTDGYMKLLLPDATGLEAGDQVSVTWQAESGRRTNGVLRSWEAGKAKGRVERVNGDGAGCTVLLPDAHAPYMGTAEVTKDGTVVGSGILTINRPASVYGYAGAIERVKCHLDESVSNGKALFTLKDYPATTSFDLRYNERVVVADLYERLIALRADPVLTAPCDGIVSAISVTETERSGKTDKADKKNVAFTIEGRAGKLTVDVDELDIVSVSVGQTAEVSFDALPGETFSATVERVSRIGKKQNSISVYPVELTMEGDERLLSGMNGTATIQAAKAENVLVIPIDAISEDGEGSFVTVMNGDGTTERRGIVTGLSDGTMTEVSEGLSQGETLSYELPGMTFADMMQAGTATVSVSSSEG